MVRERESSTAADPKLSAQQHAELAEWARKNLDAGFSLEPKLCKIC